MVGLSKEIQLRGHPDALDDIAISSYRGNTKFPGTLEQLHQRVEMISLWPF